MLSFWLGVYMGGLVVTMLFSAIGSVINAKQGVEQASAFFVILGVIGWPITLVQGVLSVIKDESQWP